jgi:DNA polymerase-3 subunit alpha
MIELKNYSTHSKEFGFLTINEILESDSVKFHGVACLVEDSTLYSSISFIEECKKRDIKPVIGLTVHVGAEGKDVGTVTLYAKNQEGFKSLVNVVNSITVNSNEDKLVDIKDVIDNNKDTFILIGSHGSLIYDSILKKDEDFVDDVVSNIKAAFGKNFYVELLSSEHDAHEEYNKLINIISEHYGVETVATNNNRFNKKGHQKLFFKKAKSTRKMQSKFDPNQHASIVDYVKTVNQNETVYFKEFPEARNNIQNIVNQIEEYSLTKDDHYLPTFDKKLRDVLREKYPAFIGSKDESKKDEYKKRIQQELETIETLGFENYFLIFDDIVKNCPNVTFALRGSSISSLVTHMMGLSPIDPVENGLLFERFLNKGRASRQELPDLDLETDDDKTVVKYLLSKYGENNIATLCTNSKLKAKSQLLMAYNTIKDDILEKPIDDNGNNRLIPEREFSEIMRCFPKKEKDPKTLQEELKTNGRLSYYMNKNPEGAKLIKMGLLFEGQVMKSGRSAASYVITPYDYRQVFSSFKNKDTTGKIDDGYNVLEVGKENIEKLGLVKLDILSNKYLSKTVNTFKRLNIDINNDSKYESKEVYKLLNEGFTSTINQLKSPIQSKLCRDVGVSDFNDIVNILALLRPGITDSDKAKFIQSKKNGDTGLKILAPILKDTHGIVIFDEQIMVIAKEIGGLSPSDADRLRSSMKSGKVKLDVIAELKTEFLNGAAKKGINSEDANKVYEMLESIAGNYTFSKAHAMAYAHLIYQQCWLKATHPAEYFEFFLDKDTDKNEKIEYVQELRQRGVVLLPLDINRSIASYKTRVSRNGSDCGVDYPMSALFFDNDDFAKLIVNERLANGAYKNLYDFVERLLPKYAGISVYSAQWLQEPKIKMNFTAKVEALIRIGGFDKLMPQGNFNVVEGRDILKNSLPNAIDLVLKPFVQGDFEYSPVSEKVKPENYINEEKSFYGGISFAEHKLLTTTIKEEKKSRPLQMKSL